MNKSIKNASLWKTMEVEVKKTGIPNREARALLVILRKLSENDLEEMGKIFQMNKHDITEEELRYYFENEPVSEKELGQARDTYCI